MFYFHFNPEVGTATAIDRIEFITYNVNFILI